MDTILAAAAQPADLLNVSDAASPYRFDRIFGGEGFGAKRLAKQRLKLVQRIDADVRSLLAEGERVDFVSWGIDYSLVDQYFMGAWAMLVSRRALVFTDRRLLMLQIDSRRRVRELKSQVRYEAIEKRERGALGVMRLKLRDGGALNLTGVPRRDRKVLRELLDAKLGAKSADAPGLGRENLCPHCGHRVVGFPESCNRCARAFKSARKAAWLSLAFPGVGDLYLGHRLMGAFEIVGGIAAWSVLVVPLAVGIGADPESLPTLGIMAGMVFTFVHGIDSWITRRVARKGIYPAE